MEKDNQPEDVKSVIIHEKKKKNNIKKCFDEYSSIEFNSRRDNSSDKISHTKNSFSWSDSHNKKNKIKETFLNQNLEENVESETKLTQEEKQKELIKTSKQMSIIKKFQRIYQTLSGKCFVVETEFERQTGIEYHNKLLNLEMIIFLISVMSILIGIVYYELSYSDTIETHDGKHLSILLYYLHFLTILLFISLILKELVLIQFELEMKIVNQGENLVNSYRYIEIVLYFVFFFLQPSPIFIGKTVQESNSENKEGKTIYSLNAILTAILLLRGFFIIRPLLYLSLFNDQETEYCCKQLNFKSSLMFTLKCLSNYASLKVFSLAMVLILLILAYAIRIFERPANDNFDNYFNALWLTIVTMTTVGYGDMTAKSSGGRVVSMIACFSGVFFVSMVIVSITSTLSLESHEYTLLAIMKKTESMEKKKEIAGKIIAKYISIITKNSNGHNYSRIVSNYKLVKDLKALILEFNLLSSENLDPSSEDFISFHSRIGFLNEQQKKTLERRKEIIEEYHRLQERIKMIKI